MTRCNKTIGLVRCPTDAATMDSLAACGGLLADPAGEPDLYYLRNSGRDLDHEIEADLFDAAGSEFDRAVREGVIPKWAPVLRPG